MYNNNDNRRSYGRSSYGRSNDEGGFRPRGFGGHNGGGSRGRSGGFGGGRRGPRRIESFNPVDFINQAAMPKAKTETLIKNSFADFAIDERIKKNIIARNYTTPTPIQDQIIPLILEGKDIIGSASTGTGKTAAFLIPLIDNVLKEKTQRVLILAPTRELAEQIFNELNLFKRGLDIFSTLCIGGSDMYRQIKDLSRDPQFVVATPGRLMDLEDRNKIFLNEFTTIVLDEFDMMLDMGFINEVKDVMSKLPTERHAVFFSATMPKKITRLVDGFLKNPVTVSVASQPSAENVQQEIVKMNGRNKVDVLCELLSRKDFEKVVVFGKTKRETHDLSQSLAKLNLRVAAIHGNKSQDQRRRALNQFKTNKVKVLLATDVISRGLDIDNVTHVINYDLPKSYEDYIHRIGRTGRANNVGTAITFVD